MRQVGGLKRSRVWVESEVEVDFVRFKSEVDSEGQGAGLCGYGPLVFFLKESSSEELLFSFQNVFHWSLMALWLSANQKNLVMQT